MWQSTWGDAGSGGDNESRVGEDNNENNGPMQE